jgi:chemotaxis protein CheY-P-specific phosphatase CheC
MPETQTHCVVETLIEALDTMAFIASEPIVEPTPCPQEPLLVRMSYSGTRSGQVLIIAPRAFGLLLAANVLGTEPDDPEAQARADDALKELLNVTVGAMMPRLAENEQDVFTLSLPELDPFDPSGWPAEVSGEWTVLNSDGHTLAVAHRVE